MNERRLSIITNKIQWAAYESSVTQLKSIRIQKAVTRLIVLVFQFIFSSASREATQPLQSRKTFDRSP